MDSEKNNSYILDLWDNLKNNKNSEYIEKVLSCIQLEEITVSKEMSLTPSNDIPHDLISSFNSTFSNKVYYISDIHLIHKIKETITDYSYKEIYNFIEQIVKQLTESVENRYSAFSGPLLLISGDVSSDFEITKLFYSILALNWNPERIIAILGNHELWGFQCSLEEIIQQYRSFFDSLNITFLHNEVLFVDKRISTSRDNLFNTDNEKTFKLSLNDVLKLNKLDKKEIDNNYCKTSFMIIGGLGFSGLSKTYNADAKIYRNTIPTLAQDIQETNKFSTLYNCILKHFEDKQVIVLSHTPMDNWSTHPYHRGWIYVSGHTHHNSWEHNNGARIYRDNQLGYFSKNYSLKHFYLTTIDYDIFQHYEDGHYIITKQEYFDFNRGLGLRGTIRKCGKIHMLKRSGIYCFFFEDLKKNKYYLLNGGVINNIEHQELDYYYEHMEIYSQVLKTATKSVQDELIKISQIIKRIGGSGNIHGTIVDIDFFNHIYINVTDGSITPYFATSVNEKYTFENIPSLLETVSPKLYSNYIKLLETDSNLTLTKKEKEGFFSPEEYFKTDIYKPSLIMKRIQALLDKNVIRIWNEDVFDLLLNDDRINNAHR